jgi:hypothetical protein
MHQRIRVQVDARQRRPAGFIVRTEEDRRPAARCDARFEILNQRPPNPLPLPRRINRQRVQFPDTLVIQRQRPSTSATRQILSSVSASLTSSVASASVGHAYGAITRKASTRICAACARTLSG